MPDTSHFHPAIRVVLRLYPQGWRDRYGAEMDAFLKEERAAGAGGFAWWTRFALDHLQASRVVRERHRGEGMMGTLMQDLRWALRSLMRARAFTAFAVLTLALGIGATSSVFTVLDRVVLRPFPWDGGDRLYHVGALLLAQDEPSVLSEPLMKAFRDDPAGAETMVGAQSTRGVLTGRGDPSRVSMLQVTGDYFEFFDGRAVVGRLLGAVDHEAGAPRTAVLREGFWRERFGADPGVVGTDLQVDDYTYTVVGVLAEGFSAPAPNFWGGDMAVSMRLADGDLDEGSFGIRAAARLPENLPSEAFAEGLSRIGAEIYPPESDGGGFVRGVAMRPLQDMVVGPEIAGNLNRLLGAVGLLLLIGCVNVASLLLTRASQRRQELTVRSALGATRGRITRQILSESVVLGLLGGLSGAAFAFGAIELFRRNVPEGIPRLAEVSLDLRVFALTLLLSIVTVLVFGLIPALRASRGGADLSAGLARGGVTRREGAIRGGLVLVETALAVVLVVWSGLLSRDLIQMSSEDAGFDPSGALTVEVSLRGRPDAATSETREVFFRSLMESVRAIPGVEHVALASELPWSGNNIVSLMTPEGHENDEEGTMVPIVPMMGDLMTTLGARIVAGRAPDPDGEDAGRMVTMVNEAFVRDIWEGADGALGVGKTIRSGGPQVTDEGTFEVVGVVADIGTAPGAETSPKMYVPFAQESWVAMNVIVRTTGDPALLAPPIRQAVQMLDPGLPLGAFRTFDTVASEALARPRFYVTLFGSFALLALVLALIGVYGTTAYATSTRTREIGIRMALGEGKGAVVGRVVRQAALVIAGGVVAGGIAASAGSAIVADSLRRVDPRDVPTYVAVITLVLAAGIGAAWLPARRLSRIDPARTLREEN